MSFESCWFKRFSYICKFVSPYDAGCFSIKLIWLIISKRVNKVGIFDWIGIKMGGWAREKETSKKLPHNEQNSERQISLGVARHKIWIPCFTTGSKTLKGYCRKEIRNKEAGTRRINPCNTFDRNWNRLVITGIYIICCFQMRSLFWGARCSVS